MLNRSVSLGCVYLAALASACEVSPTGDNGPATFRAAIAGAPGGAFLGVWAVPGVRRAIIAGGFVGVDPARISNGAVGRVVEYRWPGAFSTRCTSDSVLWWVSGAGEGAAQVVWAVGDRGRVVRMTAGRCENLTTGLRFAEGDPTFWGVLARAPGDVWIVGGSPRPDGPRGVLLHGDGVTWRRERIPDDASQENLYKITSDGDALYVVGSGGLVLRRDPLDGAWRRIDVRARTTDDRLFTVSCARGTCFAVGGASAGLLVEGDGAGWRALDSLAGASLQDLPALNGVWARDVEDVYAVGVDGATLHFDGRSLVLARTPATDATLHAVGGFDDVVLAVGGELGVATAAQRGVILTRGDEARTITLDGRVYSLSGGLQRSPGGAGQ